MSFRDIVPISVAVALGNRGAALLVEVRMGDEDVVSLIHVVDREILGQDFRFV